MNLLLWVYLTLQINFPLFNINSQQIPGYDYMGGPRSRPISSLPVTILKTRPRPELYTCHQYGLRQVCQYHNNMHATYSIYWREFLVYIHA